MLRGLDIRDMLIIDRLELAFQPGLNVLTGETGAGKSILLDSLGFVLGWRGRAELVRGGADQGEVTAWFDLPADHPANSLLEDAGIQPENELILRRVNTKDGRKSAWVNDRRVSGDVLRRLSETLVELHGQNDDRGLLNPRGHRQMLDSYAGLDGQVGKLRDAWRVWNKEKESLKVIEAQIAAAKEEEDFLRHAVSELDTLAPQPGEEAALDTKRRLMQAAEKIRENVLKAVEALGLQGAEGQMTDASRWLADAAAELDNQLDEPLAAIERSMLELDTARGEIETVLSALSFNQSDLEAAEERLFAIRAIARKHNVLADDLATFSDDLRDRLKVIDHSADALSQQSSRVKKAQAAYDAFAAKLSELRKKAAKKLDQAMSKELAPLKMERAVFTTAISDVDAGPDGFDEVSFTVATNPGAPAGPLNKIASGGELSRFLLALKVCLTKTSDTGVTMIFDEIDRGVGGATADAVGRRLTELASAGQILVVTHSPQVAALGQHHWRVEKSQSDTETLSTVVSLDAASRVDEIARMLSGDKITEAAKEAARVLLDAQ